MPALEVKGIYEKGRLQRRASVQGRSIQHKSYRWRDLAGALSSGIHILI